MRTSERVYTLLREDILAGVLAPGQALGEIEQSARLGVSRTPLREALARLQTEGLVQARGGRGLVVAEVSLDAVRHLFEIREALESTSASLAAERRDVAVFTALREEIRAAGERLADPADRDHFYALTARMDEEIDAAAANPYLRVALRGVRGHVARLRRVSRDDAERLRSATQEHLMILDAIIDGSSAMAAAATRLHLHRSLASIVRTLPAPPSEEDR